MKKHKYNIAVMLPTRARTDALSRSIFSIIDHADDLTKIQFLFAIDDDDQVGLDHFFNVIQPVLDEKNINYTALSTPRLGYQGLNVYYNTLAASADADWLMVWTDDAIMNTNGWDLRIRECTGEFKLLKVHTHNEHPYSIFPIMPVEWYKLKGCFSRHQLIDTENSHMAYMLDLMKIIEVDVTHDRSDLTGNNQDQDPNKEIFEGNPNNPKDFYHPTFHKIRLDYCEKFQEYMKSKNLDTTFWENVKAGTQDPWQRMRENDPNKQTSQFAITTDYAGQQRMVKQ
jgi:hypothetical protein